jgi:hypothetical protein
MGFQVKQLCAALGLFVVPAGMVAEIRDNPGRLQVLGGHV